MVWQKAQQLVLEVYRLSSNFPKTETYRLTSSVKTSVCISSS
ncbi:four helix bundle protein [Dapis sp. BLCC M126]